MPTPLTDADKVIRNDTGLAIAAAIEALAAPEADRVGYDNTSSGLTADNAQDAIDELKTKNDTKMDKTDPTGTGVLSMNRKAGTAIGDRSGTVGTNNTASGESSFAEGNSNTASGIRAHAEGSSNTASGDYSHVEGAGSTASGERSHAEGSGTKASKYGAHAEGDTTVASGDNGSHAEGYHTTSEGRNSHSEGRYTIANHRSQHVFGEYNDPDPSSNLKTARGNYIEIVGKGSNDANRSNARTLDWNGNETLAGGLQINGNQPVSTIVPIDVSSLSTSINDKASWDSAFSNLPTTYMGMVNIAFKSGYKVVGFAIKTASNWGSIMGMTNDNLNPYFYTMANGTSVLHRLAYV